jgi:di/tricarboxylate transporter
VATVTDVDDATLAFLVMGGAIALFVWNRLPVEVVAVGTALALWATGLLELPQALSGFGDPVVLFIAGLFVVSEAIDSAGVTTWAGQRVIARVGESRTRLVIAMMGLAAVLSAIISINGAVAALIPMVVLLAVRQALPTSHLMMPLAFAGSAGSLLALTGSPVNVIATEAAAVAGERPFGFFEFGLLGVPLLLGTVAIAVLLAHRVLPARESASTPPDLSRYACTLVAHYELDGGLFRLRVRPGSPLAGSVASDIDLSEYGGIAVVGGQEQAGPAVASRPLEAGDEVVVRGDPADVGRLAAEQVLAVVMQPSDSDPAQALINRDLGVAEVVIPPRSELVGEVVFPGMRRPHGLVVLAVQRLGEDRGPRETALEVGDTLLVQGTWDALDELVERPRAMVVGSPDLVRRQTVAMGPRATRAVVILAVMVVLLATRAVPPSVAALLAAGAMVLARVVKMEQIYRSMSWTTLILIGGLIPLSTALRESGAADQLASLIVSVVGDSEPRLLLLALFVLTGLLGQVLSNTATALIVIPIAVSAASDLGISARPVIMLTAVAASAAFLTPIATPANMMVMGPGGYHFGDYWRLGLPVMLWFLVASVLLVPVFWPF